MLHLAANALISAPFAVIAYGGIAGRTDFQVQEVDLPIPGLQRDLEGVAHSPTQRYSLLADAEQIIALKSFSDKCMIVATGSIDDSKTKSTICRILEGA